MHPSILDRMAKEGHEVANHVWNHPVLSKLPFEEVHNQIVRTNDAIQKATSQPPKVMRPPYGNTNNKLNQYLTKKEKLPVIMWSLDTLDWKRPAPDEIVSRVVKHVKPGDIILCHDIHPGTVEAIPKIVDALIAQGYKFVTVSELLSQPKKALRG